MTERVNTGAVRAQKTQEALTFGFPITCATCDHLYNAWDKRAEDCGKTATCGGPIFGRNYPDYKGPIPPQALGSLCLICGSKELAFHIIVRERRFGLCFKDRARFDHIIGANVIRPLIVPVGDRIT